MSDVFKDFVRDMMVPTTKKLNATHECATTLTLLGRDWTVVVGYEPQWAYAGYGRFDCFEGVTMEDVTLTLDDADVPDPAPSFWIDPDCLPVEARDHLEQECRDHFNNEHNRDDVRYEPCANL